MADYNLIDVLINNSELKIRYLNKACHDGKWYERTSKYCYDLWVVLKGSAKVTMDKIECTLTENDLFLFYPDIVYEAYSLTDSFEFIYLHFDYVIGENTKSLNDYTFGGYIPNCVAPYDISKFIEAYNGVKIHKPVEKLALKGYLYVILARIMDYKMKENYDYYTADNKKIKLTRLEGAFRYIHENTQLNISVYELAEKCGMSEKYFITFFKKAVGMTPAKYIMQTKMNKAMFLMGDGKYTIAQISNMVGYSDPFTFSKAFKKIYGVSPSYM